MSAGRVVDERRAQLDDELLDPSADPGGTAFGTSGSEASTDLNWMALLRTRVQACMERSGRHRWWVLSALLAGLFSLNFTFTAFVVTLPELGREFRTSELTLTWTMIGPLLAYGLAAPAFGKVGDALGHRRLYQLGLVGAMFAAVATALAPNAPLLIAARTIDGVQGAATGTASMALILSSFAPEDRSKAMGWWSLVGAGGPVLGMSIGSPVIQYLGWRMLFWLQLGLLVIAATVVSAVLPRRGPKDHEAHSMRRIDWTGSWALSGAVTVLMLGLSLSPTIGWTSVGSIACFAACVLGIVVFVVRLRTAANPLIPPQYFRQRNFVLPMVQRCAGNFAYFGAFFLAPLVMELGYGFSVTKVAFVSIPRPLCFALAAPIAGYAAARVGERTTAVAGALSLTGSLVLFAMLTPASPLWLLVIALALSGVGMGAAMPATSSSMANEVDEADFGVTSAAQLLALQVGEVAGIEVLTAIQVGLMHSRGLTKSSSHAALLSTFREPFEVGAVVAVVAVVAAVGLRSMRRGAPVSG